MQIKKVISERGWSHASLADRLGISPSSFSQFLANESPNVKTLRRIANIIGCRIGDFFADELSPSAPQDTTPTYICPHCGKEIALDIRINKKGESR